MENNLSKPINIEFYGLPGSGKSTISHMVAESLRNNGYLVVEPSYSIDHNNKPLLRKIKKLLITLLFAITNIKQYLKIKKLVKNNNYHGIEKIKQIVNIVPKIWTYKFENNNYIYVWDEGITQSSISLSMFNLVDFNNNFKNLYNINSSPNIINIYLKVTEETAIERLKKRATNESRVEKYDEIGLCKIIKKLYTSLNSFELPNNFQIDCNDSIKIDEIEKYIISLFLKQMIKR